MAADPRTQPPDPSFGVGGEIRELKGRLLPAALGYTPDAATGIKGDDYKTAQAFESRKLLKAHGKNRVRLKLCKFEFLH